MRVVMGHNKVRGTVKWFNRMKGYGFVESPEVSKDVFIHHTGILGEGRKNLWEGDRVEFELADNGDKGFKAIGLVVTR